MNLHGGGGTAVGGDEVGAVAEVGVVEGVVAGGDGVFVACAHSQPVAGVFLDLEGHAAGTVALLLQGGLHQPEVVVIALG